MIKEITALAKDDDGLEAVVIGWPRRLDGSPTDQTDARRGVRARLEAQIAVPVVLQDERLSSHEAESRLAARESDWRKRKAKLDAAAAAIILQDYLDGRDAGEDDRHDAWIKRLLLFLVVLVAAIAGAGGWWIYRADRRAVSRL